MNHCFRFTNSTSAAFDASHKELALQIGGLYGTILSLKV